MEKDPQLGREEDLFHQVSAMPEDERIPFFQAACSGDLRLFARIQELLRADAAPLLLLEQSVVAPLQVIARAAEELTATDLAGEGLGPYTLVRRIGEGGWGVVYLAEQTEPVRHRSR